MSCFKFSFSDFGACAEEVKGTVFQPWVIVGFYIVYNLKSKEFEKMLKNIQSFHWTSGRVITKVVPTPSSLSTLMEPLKSVTIRFT